MLGPLRPISLDGVEVDGDTSPGRGRLRLVAARDLAGIATGRFARPSAGVRWDRGGVDPDVEFCGFAFTQFALPVVAGADLAFDFAPAHGLRSPRAVLPLLARAGGRVTLLAPLRAPHEQVIAVDAEGLTWGWHGDLDEVPAGFVAELGVYEGGSVAQVLDAWRADLHPIVGRRPDNPLSTHLSYWTDNGAAYWYRTEPGRTIAESVADTVEALRADGVPIGAVELDSWCYPQAVPRPIDEIGYPSEVPPSGAMTWTPRADAFPPGEPGSALDPIETFAERLGRPPLVIHARHVDPGSPYVTDGVAAGEEWWIDDLAAQPADPAFFRRWFDDARRWGACAIEQDWMLMYWFGVRALRAVPDRAAAWQRALDEHAAATGVDLVWCMATPADLVLAASLERVIAVRTCDDYRFADDPAFLWTWFLTVNRLTNALGLAAFKDCFFTRADLGPGDDPIDGDPHAEVEALLAALSGGPVGIGDRLGRTDRMVLRRTVDDDGRIRRVDRALAMIDDCLFGGPARGDGLAWATTTATVAHVDTPDAPGVPDAGGAGGDVWTYVVAINTATERRTVVDRLALGDRRHVYDWRSAERTVADELTVELAPRDWALWVVAPAGVDPDSFGDTTRYVTVESTL